MKYTRLFRRTSSTVKSHFIKFVKIVTAPESKSRLEEIIVGHRLDNEDIVTRLSAELANMALSRGHSLKITHIREVFSSASQGDSEFAPLAIYDVIV